MIPDLINGLFEFVAGIMLWLNVRALYQDKAVRGVRVFPTAFFAVWGAWNCYLYPHVGLRLSFFGGLNLLAANIVWGIQMVYYARRAES